MNDWIWILIALVIVVVATRGRHRVQTVGHGHPDRSGSHRKPVADQQPQTADSSNSDIRKDPNLEYQGEVYFFCSIEERDAFSANLQLGEYRPDAASSAGPTIERRM